MQLPQNIITLIEKYQSGTATAQEVQELNRWYRSLNDEEIEIDIQENLTPQQLSTKIKNKIDATLTSQSNSISIESPPNIRPVFKWKIAVVAAILLFSVISVFVIVNFSSKNHLPVVSKVNNTPLPKTDIAPGGNKAMLTLADGTHIILDSATTGLLSNQGNVKIEKLDNGKLIYRINGKEITENDESFYNTISTPRGGQYQVTLADGSKVWLNAASSIRFPVVFTGKERKVEITGEAYFEVERNTTMPFKVKATTSEVEVLGTHFNVNAYDDEASIRTTLLEGKVKVMSSPTEIAKILTPGQQSSINKSGKINVQDDADVEEAVAWKNGKFQFKSADLKSILRQISRWYNVDVEYYGDINLHFSGQLTRDVNVSKVFTMLTLTDEVRFKIEGQKIIVSPK